MNKEAKVGALVIFFMIFTIGLAVWIVGNPFRKTTLLHVRFHNVHGLSAGSPVEYAGLSCGKVQGFDVTPNGIVTKVLITNPKVKIHANDRFVIIPSSTIASEYQIFIIPSPEPSPEVPEEASIVGQSAPGMQDFLFKGEEALDDLQIALKQIQAILSETENSAKEISPFFKKIGDISHSGKLDSIVNDIKEVATNSNELLKHNKESVSQTMASIRSVSRQIDDKLNAIDSADLKESLSSLKKTLNHFEKIATVIQPEDVKAFADAARQTKEIMSKLQSEDPAEDVPSLLRETVKSVNHISTGLEKQLQKKKLYKVLFSKVSMTTSKNKSDKKENSASSKKLIKINLTPTSTMQEKEPVINIMIPDSGN